MSPRRSSEVARARAATSASPTRELATARHEAAGAATRERPVASAARVDRGNASARQKPWRRSTCAAAGGPDVVRALWPDDPRPGGVAGAGPDPRPRPLLPALRRAARGGRTRIGPVDLPRVED